MIARLFACAAAGAGVLAGLGCEVNDRDIEPIKLAEVRSLSDERERSPKELLLIDPRAERAYTDAHLPGAVHLQTDAIDEIRGRDPLIESYKNLVVYGDDPSSAPGKAMTKTLMRAGYKDVRFFVGGLREWRAAGLPVETGPGARLRQ